MNYIFTKQYLQNWFNNTIGYAVAVYLTTLLNWSPRRKTSRGDYVRFLIVNALVAITIMQIEILTGLYSPYWGLGPVYALYIILTFWPGFCIVVRRFRDVGYSPHRLWWLAVPVIGWVMCIWWVFQPEDAHRYTLLKKRKKRVLQLS
jgi:uncharacterized membrane protein YhaH (DUF805 family)